MVYPTYKEFLAQLNIPPKYASDYQAFLRSKYWWICKQAVTNRDEGRCRNCLTDLHLEVHHLTYKHHGDELNHLEDLVTLCHDCHAGAHGHEPTRRGGCEHISHGLKRILSKMAVANGLPYLPDDLMTSGGYTPEHLQKLIQQKGQRNEQSTCLQSPQAFD